MSETLEPLWPPESMTLSLTRTEASDVVPTVRSAERTSVEVPCMRTGAMARWSLWPVHATGWDVPRHQVARNGRDRRMADEGGRVVDVEGDEVPVVVPGPHRRHQRSVTHAVVPALPVVVGEVEPELEAAARSADHRAGNPGPFRLRLGRHRDRLGARAAVRVDTRGRAHPAGAAAALLEEVLDRHARGQRMGAAVGPEVGEGAGAGEDDEGDPGQHPAEGVTALRVRGGRRPCSVARGREGRSDGGAGSG